MADQFRADRLTASGDEGQQVRVQTGLVIEAHGLGGDQGRLFGGLGQDGVAGGEGGGDLAGEDGQREIPRADAGEDAATVQDQLVDLADGPLELGRAAEVAFGQHGVVAAEVGSLADFGHAVVQGLAGLARKQGDQPVHIGFQRIGHGAQHSAPARAALAVPGDLGAGGGVDGGVDVSLGRFRDMAQDAGRIERIGDRLGIGPGLELAADDRAGGQGLAVDLLQRDGVALTVGGLRIVAAQRVLAVHVHVLRGRDLGVAVGVGLDGGDGVGGDGGSGHPLVQQGVDERGVGPVLEQAAHQIGQQVLMPADGGIGADRHGAEGVTGGVVERLAHAVQALEFDLHRALGRHPVDGG